MNYILSSNDREILKQAEKITGTEYDDKGKRISVETCMAMIEDLVYEYEALQDKLKDMEDDIKDNYRPLTPKELINYREGDFC